MRSVLLGLRRPFFGSFCFEWGDLVIPTLMGYRGHGLYQLKLTRRMQEEEMG